MTQSFDEWFGEFDEKNQCYPEKRECYEAGAQSRQAEIDELQEKVNREREQATEYFTDLEYANAKLKELLKRIDKALIQVSNHYHSCVARKALKQMSASASEIAEIEAHEASMAVLENILKGKESEN